MDDILNVKVCARTDRGFKRETNEDRFLILDGESELIDKDVLSQSYSVNDKCRRLVAQALQMGGNDNVTVIVIQV